MICQVSDTVQLIAWVIKRQATRLCSGSFIKEASQQLGDGIVEATIIEIKVRKSTRRVKMYNVIGKGGSKKMDNPIFVVLF